MFDTCLTKYVCPTNEEDFCLVPIIQVLPSEFIRVRVMKGYTMLGYISLLHRQKYQLGPKYQNSNFF